MNNQHIKIFSSHLDLLSKFIEQIESCVGGDPSILEARLVDDMLPLFTQAEIAASFALRASCPIAKVQVVSFAQSERTFSGLQAQLSKTIKYLISLDNEVSDISVGEITDMAGSVKVTLSTLEYLNSFALPNFFFHLSMVYAIARAKGIPATKGDFDGIHKYPVGFSFEK